jgi:protein O-GlcNAc transferase
MNRHDRRALAKLGTNPERVLRPGRAPRIADVTLENAVMLGRAGKLDAAVAEYRGLLAKEPGNALAHSNLGCVLTQLRKLDEATLHFRRAIALKPNFADAYSNLACLVLDQRNYAEAEALARRCVTIDPRAVKAWISLGCAVYNQGNVTDAKDCFRKATELDPNHTQAWVLLGNAMFANREALPARECFNRAIALDARNAEAHAGLGAVLTWCGLYDQGGQSLAHALSLNPRNPNALMNLAASFYMRSEAEAAKQAYRAAIELAPDLDAAKVKFATTVPLIVTSKDEIGRYHAGVVSELERLLAAGPLRIADPYLHVNLTNFHTGYYGLNEAEINRGLAQVLLKACPELDWVAPHCRTWNKPERLRVGIITAFSQDHIVGELFRAVAKHFDRKRFEVIAFYPPLKEATASQMAPDADQTIVLPPSLFDARKAVADVKPDVMFFLDTFVDPFIYFLSFARLAPVQCTTWGHPITTGLPNMDFFISADDWEHPDADPHYTERLVKLKEMPMYFGKPPLPEHPMDRSKLGLPEDAKLYACIQSLFKLHPDFDQALGNILRRDRKGILFLLTGQHPHWNVIFMRRFRSAFADVANRLIFLPRISRTEYLALLMASDAILDPFHWGGGNTTIEALACGVPVPTLPAAYLRGRLTLGFYRKMAMPELITGSSEEFVELNCRIANDADFRAELKRKVAERLPLLYQNIGAIRELERFFLKITDAMERGETPFASGTQNCHEKAATSND